MPSCFKPVQFILRLKGKPVAGFLIPVAMAVLVGACSSSSKETANALAQALNPPTAQRGDEAGTITRGPEEFVAKGVADQNINRDISGQSLSVVVRILQLRDRGEFTRLSFEGVTNRNDADLFPKDLVAASEMVVMPGTTQEITDKLLPETKYVGVIGFFRRPDAQYWRMLYDARAVRNEGLIIVAKDCYFSAITPRIDPMPGQTASYKPECTGFISPNRSRK